jgi:hypothetical protein
LSLVCIPGIAFSSYVFAQPPELYFGAGYGQYKFEFHDDDIDTDFSEDKEVNKLIIGGNFTDVVGIEFNYLDFGDVEDNGINLEVDGMSLGGVLHAPISDYFSIFGKAGVLSWEADINGQLGTGPAAIAFREKIEGDDLYYGIGAKFGLGHAVDLRVDYDRYEVDEDFDPELDIVSAAVQFNF